MSSNYTVDEHHQRLKRHTAAIGNAGLGILQNSKKPNEIFLTEKDSKTKIQTQGSIEVTLTMPMPSKKESKENDFQNEFDKFIRTTNGSQMKQHTKIVDDITLGQKDLDLDSIKQPK